MFDSILNAIAERSQALKDKDAEIATWSELANGLQETNMELRELVQGNADRNQELKALADRADAGELAANERTIAATQRADAAESQLLQIASALGLGAVDVDVTLEEPAAVETTEAPAQEA